MMNTDNSNNPTNPKWQNGYFSGARQAYSPNQCQRPKQPINLVVLHNISLPPFEYGSDAVERLFTNTINEIAHENPFFEQLIDFRVSSHFFIRRTGEIVQFVSCDEMAYHAGVSQFQGREKCNTFSIGIELEGCDFEPFSELQYQALIPLLRELSEQYPIQAITGHQHIAPNRKTDPGHFFDWQRLKLENLPIVD